MCQAYEFCVNALECPLHICTHDIVSSSPLLMMRETIRSLWSNIYIHMTDCHYVSSHQNMSFESDISKNTQFFFNKFKKLKKRVWDSLPMSPYSTPSGRGMSRSPEIHPCIGVVIDGNDLTSPPWKEVHWVGVSHPTSTQSAHNIFPMSLGWILNSLWRNFHSRA